MKTAMQELIDYMKTYFHLTDESLEMFDEALKKEKEHTIELSDEEIEKGALEWCLGVDERGTCNTGDDYDNHELPAFIAACKWYREQLKGK
jgi:hypothetical protein